jgi:hypothetical protein
MLVDIAFRAVSDAASRAWEILVEGFEPSDWLSREGITSVMRFTRPIEPFNQPEFAAPLVGIAGIVLSLVLVGVAISSLSSLLIALLALGFVLTRIYGVSLEIGGLS